jgi:hypothetical protein
LDELDVFALVVEALCSGNGDPLAGGAGGSGFEVFGIKITILFSFEAELDGGGRGIIDGCLEFRIRTRLDPEKSADAEARDQDDAGDERTQVPQVGLE